MLSSVTTTDAGRECQVKRERNQHNMRHRKPWEKAGMSWKESVFDEAMKSMKTKRMVCNYYWSEYGDNLYGAHVQGNTSNGSILYVHCTLWLNTRCMRFTHFGQSCITLMNIIGKWLQYTSLYWTDKKPLTPPMALSSAATPSVKQR